MPADTRRKRVVMTMAALSILLLVVGQLWASAAAPVVTDAACADADSGCSNYIEMGDLCRLSDWLKAKCRHTCGLCATAPASTPVYNSPVASPIPPQGFTNPVAAPPAPSTCLDKQRAQNFDNKGPTTILMWHETWISEFFSPPYTERCPMCSFTTDRAQAASAKGILYSVPEIHGLASQSSYSDMEEVKAAQRMGSAKLMYMCLEAANEYPACFPNLPPAPGETAGGGSSNVFDLFVGHQACADVPALYPMPTAEQMLAPMPTKVSGTELVSFFSGNCREDRDKRVSELMEAAVSVASYGSCLNNKDVDTGGRTQGFEGNKGKAKMDRMGKHMFNWADEGYIEPYYFSEKLWEPFQAGSVPIYYGASAQLEFEKVLPEGSWINAADKAKFPTIKALADFLLRLSKSPAEYATYFEWKRKPLPPAFVVATKLDWKNLACNICNAPGLHGR